MGKRLFQFLSPLVRPFAPRLRVEWTVPFDGEPCIFICNHERATGPLEMALRFPLREESYIWIYAGPLSRETFPEYIRQDHWWNENGRLASLWDRLLPPILSRIIPPVLRSVQHVPVYHDSRAVTTMKESLRLLQAGKNLVIFPEIPTGFGEHDTEKINEGWLFLLPLYEKRTGKQLKIWPVHLELAEKVMQIRPPFTMETGTPVQQQFPALTQKVLAGIF